MQNKNTNLNNLLVRINPLNIKFNYNDNATLYKFLLDFCKDNDTKKLGNELIDSFLLFNILKINKGIKSLSSSYDKLCQKLSISINRYSKLEKVLRNNSILVPVIISNRNEVENFNVDNLDLEQVYVLVSPKYEKFSSINNLFGRLNLVKNVLCINNKELLNDFHDNLKDFSDRLVNVEYSEFTRNIINKKNILLSETIVSDENLSDGQIDLFNKINEEFQNLLSIEYKINFIEVLLDKLMGSIFNLETDINKDYHTFREDCEKLLSKYIKERLIIGEQLSIDLETYRNSFSTYYDLNDTSNEKLHGNIEEERLKYFKMYLYDSIYSGDFKPFNFIKYLKENASDNVNLLKNEKETEDRYLSMYSSYLIYKASLSNDESALSFEEYIKDNYDVENIDFVYRMSA